MIIYNIIIGFVGQFRGKKTQFDGEWSFSLKNG